jgi:hypothetical protein
VGSSGFHVIQQEIRGLFPFFFVHDY